MAQIYARFVTKDVISYEESILLGKRRMFYNRDIPRTATDDE